MTLQTFTARQPRGALASVAPHRIVEVEPVVFEPNGDLPYHMKLSDIVSQNEIQKIINDGKIAFQTAGDTGGIKRPEVQALVCKGMENALIDDPIRPSFFYHLGDVVYYNGLVRDYFGQFYEPYENYPLPIFGIPGNHDGEKETKKTVSLEGFYRNFCSKAGVFQPESKDVGRMAMCQPYVYWSLDTPFAYFVGLYTNVPEHGHIDDAQREWFHREMRAAPREKTLVLCLHHPIYSFDDHHSGSKKMAREVSDAINVSRRVPNLILTAHVHNYQRVEWQFDGGVIPIFVIGSGGYWHLHNLSAAPGFTDDSTGAVLKAGIDDRHGFATFEIGSRLINGRFTTVPRPQESWSNPNGYNENADVFSYSAVPLFLGKDQTVSLEP